MDRLAIETTHTLNGHEFTARDGKFGINLAFAANRAPRYAEIVYHVDASRTRKSSILMRIYQDGM